MKKVLLVSAILLALVAGVVFVQNYLKTKTLFPFKKNSTVIINDHKLQVAVADSQEEQEIGLSETKSLPENQGMIFLFEKPGFYSFWMKNMKLPIDIIFINKNRIITILQNIEPLKDNNENLRTLNSSKPTDSVLEINAGLSKKYGFKEGDIVKYENLSN